MLRLPGCIAVLALVVLADQASAQARRGSSGGPIPPEQAAYDVRFYDLSLTVDPADSSLSGANVIHADVLAPLSLFLVDLDTVFAVPEVALTSGESLAFERRGGTCCRRR